MTDISQKTIEELQQIVKDYIAAGEPTEYRDADNLMYHGINWGGGKQPIELADGITFQGISAFGGEGEGDSIGATFKINDRYFSIGGYHASHDGTYPEVWEWTEVEPVEVTETKYFPKKVG